MALQDGNGNDLLNMERGESLKKGEDLNDLMKVNRVKYNFPQDLSLVQSRNVKINYADISTYQNTAGEVVIRIVASTEYLIPENAYLQFKVRVKTTAGADPAQEFYLTNDAGAVGLFSRLLIESADGSEIERIDFLNHKVRNYLALMCNMNYIKSVGTVAGLNGGATNVANNVTDNYILNNVANTFARCDNASFQCCIPLHWISGLFRSKKLLPASLIAGMRFRLQMETPANAFQLSGASAETVIYEIQSAQIMSDSVSLSPMIERKLLEVAGSQGLDVYYDTDFYSGVSFTSTSVSFNVYKSVSRACGLLFITQSQTGQTKALNDGNQKPTIFGTTPLNMIKSQIRLGSLYFAQQPYVSDTVTTGGNGLSSIIRPANAVNMFYNYTHVGPNHNCDLFEQNSTISYKSYLSLSAGTDNESDNKYVCNYQTLEKISSLELSGLPVNNSRNLTIDLLYANAITGGQILKTWLNYIKLAKCFANNVVIKE